MARSVVAGRFGSVLLAGVVAGFVACGGGSDDGSSGSSGSGGSGGSANGHQGGSSNGSGGGSTELGWPAKLPTTSAACASASGADACYYDGCCSELVACAKNADCAKTYGCYVSCPSSDSTCFVNCAGSSLENGAEDFGNALSCLAPLTLTCGNLAGGGGSGGSSSGGDAGAGGVGTPTDVGPLGSAHDSLGWDLNVSDQPLVAELEPDTKRAVGKEITVEGGTLEATAADGTTFELVIPPGALYGPTSITLTPLASLAVPPLDGASYGVQIQPDGLELMGSPTLRITPPDGETWPIDQQLPLSITGDGTAALALFEPASEALELVLTHFSSYGLLLTQKGIGATLSQADIRSRFAGDVEDRLQSAAAERLGRERHHQLLGVSEGDGLGDLVAELFPEYEEHVLKPRVAKAGESCAAGKLAMQTVLGFERQKELLGVSGNELPFLDLLPVVADVCLKEEYELCRDQHIITRVLVALFSYWRQAQLLGLGTDVGGVTIPPDWVMKAEEYAKSCLKFELRFDSDVVYSESSPDLSMRESVSASVPVKLNASFTTVPTDSLPPVAQENGALIFGGPSPLASSGYSVGTNERCRTINGEHSEDGELYVAFMGFTPGLTTEDTPGGSPEVLDFSVSLAISPNLSNYDFTQQEVTDSGCGAVQADGNDTLSWSTSLGSYLLETYATGDNGALLDAWEIQHDGGAILAVKDISLKGGQDTTTYRGPVNLVLLHTPDP